MTRSRHAIVLAAVSGMLLSSLLSSMFRCRARAEPRCEKPRCAASADPGGAAGGGKRAVRCRAVSGARRPSAVRLGGIRRAQARYRHAVDDAGAVLPQALRRPGGGRCVPRRVVAGAVAAPGLADAARGLETDFQCRPAMRRTQRAPGHGQGRCAMDRRCAEALDQQRQSLPDSCDPVFAILGAQGGLPPALRWERIEKAAAEQQPAVMRSAARGLPAAEAALASEYASFLEVGESARAQLAADRAQPQDRHVRPDAPGQVGAGRGRDATAAIRHCAGHGRGRTRQGAVRSRVVDGGLLRSRFGAAPECGARIGLRRKTARMAGARSHGARRLARGAGRDPQDAHDPARGFALAVFRSAPGRGNRRQGRGPGACSAKRRSRPPSMASSPPIASTSRMRCAPWIPNDSAQAASGDRARSGHRPGDGAVETGTRRLGDQRMEQRAGAVRRHPAPHRGGSGARQRLVRSRGVLAGQGAPTEELRLYELRFPLHHDATHPSRSGRSRPSTRPGSQPRSAPRASSIPRRAPAPMRWA